MNTKANHFVTKASRCLLIAVAGLVTQTVSAQNGPTISVEGEYLRSSSAKIKDGIDNRIKLDKAMTSVSLIDSFWETSTCAVVISGSRTKYDFEHKMPWSEVNEVSGLLMWDQQITDDLNLVGIGFARSALSKNARFKDGFTWASGIAAKYRMSESFSMMFGAGYLTRLEDNGIVIPIVGIEWQATDRLTVEGLLGLTVRYDLWGDRSGKLSVGFDYEFDDFRLKRDAVSGLKSAVRPRGGALSVSYAHRLSEQASLTLKVSSYGEQKFDTISDGKKLSFFKTDPIVLYGVGLDFTF